MLIRWIIFVLILACICGCANKGKTDKEKLTLKWNQARAGVMHSLARDQYKTGAFDKSRKTIDEAMALDPMNANLYVLSAKIAIEQGQLERAEKDLGAAREFDPTNAEAEYLSGVVYQRWQKHELAYECYTRASEKAPAELAYLLARAEALVTLERANDALAILQDKVVYFEHSAAIRDAVGQLLLQQGRYTEACDILRQASVLATDDSSIREHFAMALFYNRNFRESHEVLSRLMKDPDYASRGDLYTALGETQLEINQPREARTSFEHATQLQPASIAAWMGLCKAALAANDLRRADLASRKVHALEPASAEAQLLIGYVRLKQEKDGEALAAFRKASALNPNDPVSLCMIGYVLERTGRSAEAMPYYAQALRLSPNDDLATLLMANVDIAE